MCSHERSTNGEQQIVPIAQNNEFKDVHDCFRELEKTPREFSKRTLALTKAALRLYATNYHVWQFRRDILKALKEDLHEELEYVEEVMTDHSMQFLVWHHRRVIVEWLRDGSRELRFTERFLETDATNDLAWRHRQWAIQTFRMLDEAVVYLDQVLARDVRNMAAWDERFFIISCTGYRPDVLQHQVSYTLDQIRLVKDNEHSWNFLRRLLSARGDLSLCQSGKVVAFVEDLFAVGCRALPLIGFIIDMYTECVLSEDTTTPFIQRVAYRDKVIDLCEQMRDQYDVFRARYWEFVLFQFVNQFEEMVETQSRNF